MLYERVKVTRDTNTVYSPLVAPWEIAILEFTFEPGNVVRTEKFERTDGPYPEPTSELNRLCTVYGSDPQSGVPYAIQVYGNGSVGVNALRREIAEAKTRDEATAPAVAKKQRRRTAPKAAVLADPLMA